MRDTDLPSQHKTAQCLSECWAGILKGSSVLTVGHISKKNAAMQIETTLHIALKFQVDRACFHKKK